MARVKERCAGYDSTGWGSARPFAHHTQRQSALAAASPGAGSSGWISSSRGNRRATSVNKGVGGSGHAGWRKRGRFAEGTPRGNGGKLALIGGDGLDPVGGVGGEEFEFVLLDGGGLLLLGLLAFIDHFAELAGVFAVEGLADGLGEGGVLGVGDGHVDPGDDLEQGPVRAERKRERQGYQDFATTGKHDDGNVGLSPEESTAKKSVAPTGQ